MEIPTVIFSSATMDDVAVIVNVDPEFSAILVELTESVTVGVLSFSEMVIVTACVPFSVASPPETPSIEIVAVSSPSYTLSSVGLKLIVSVVLPAVITRSSIFPLPSV